MNDVREEPGCYQCGSFAGTTFRLCENCLSQNEQRRDTIRLRRSRVGTLGNKARTRASLGTLAALVTIILLFGAAAAAYLYLVDLLSA